MRKIWDIVIVGGGASGLAAAVAAVRSGADVLVIEKNHVPGRKILSTGAGKCNFTNEQVSAADYNAAAADFLKEVFSILPPYEIIKFFENLGLLWTKGEKGKIFPRSMKAQDVADVLAKSAVRNGAEISLLTQVYSVSKNINSKDRNGIFCIEAGKVPPQWEKKQNIRECAGKNKEKIYARRIIMSAGSPCCSRIGGSSAGYSLLEKIGHSCTEIFPVITPLAVKEKYIKDIDGVRTEGSVVFKYSGPEYKDIGSIAASSGEIIFARGFLSGPPVIDCARRVQDAMRKGPVNAEIDFYPDYSMEAFSAMIEKRRQNFLNVSAEKKGISAVLFRDFAAGLHNEKIIMLAASLAGIETDAPLNSVRTGSFGRFGQILKNFTLSISGPAGFDDAAAAAGGINLDEVNPRTFESHIVPGLYITGEILNVDGRSGGFNLHFAWTSGIIAARAAAAGLADMASDDRNIA